MDGSMVDDSGIDSDQNKMPIVHGQHQPPRNESPESTTSLDELSCVSQAPATENEHETKREYITKTFRKSSELQKKIERHRAMSRKSQGTVVSHQPASRPNVVARSRLFVPTKSDVLAGSRVDTQPLVIIDVDESEDEFATPRLSKLAQREIAQQLIKDGYNLDLEPDDDDLDLIPPRPLNERCICCNTQVNCSIQ